MLLTLQVLYEVCQPVRSVFPQLPLFSNPRFGNHQSLEIDAACSDAPSFLGCNQTAVFQHADVFKEGRQRHVEWGCQVLHGRGSGSQAMDNGATGWVCERAKDAVQLQRASHSANYSKP